MDNNGWDQYKIHILNEIQDLKDASDSHGKSLDAIQRDLAGFKTNQKWEMRIASMIWGLIMLGFNAIMGHHKS